jgi:GT2 family glycosyltransferase/glycosyltransferase involved in cell wall biosynthesis
MPFNEEGIWVDPTAEEIAETKDRLVNPAAYEGQVDMPDSVKQQLLSYAATEEITWREHENHQLYSMTQSVATDESMVSIIMPVYNALHLAKKCFKSIIERTRWPYELIIINDASPDKEVENWLLEIGHEDFDVEAFKNFEIVTNSSNRGFAATVNRGMRMAKGKYVCLMNSDVIVTENWATKMVIALESDPSHVIVNPATNNTALIDIPMVPGKSYLDMNRALERSSTREYPEIMPTGFCFMFRKNLVKKIGYFDEAFRNYGEETDFWFKSLAISDEDGKYMKHKAVLSDDCFVFHERGSSFTSLGEEIHMGLRRGASDRFHALHPGFQTWRKGYSPENALKKLRTTLPPDFYNGNYPYNIAYVVKTPKFCGGMKFIADIVNALIEKGANAQVCVIKNNPEADEEFLGELHTAPIFFEDDTDFVNNFSTRAFEVGIVVAAVNELVPAVGELTNSHELLAGMHHVQSYDPALIESEDTSLKELMFSLYGKLPFSIVSSNWIKEILDKNSVSSVTVLPGVEKDLFHRGDREKGDDRFTVLMPVIPKYWFKGTSRAYELARELFKLFEEKGKEIRVMAYGVYTAPEVPNLICLGELSQARISALLQTEVDVFVDPSQIHSYGMPAAEALASGVRVFSWDNKGIHDVASVGTTVLGNDVLPITMAKEIYTFCEHDVHNSPFYAEIPDRQESVEAFIREVEDRYLLQSKVHTINVVTPHARKHGGPTTIINLANVLAHLGHSVNLVTNYTDFSQEVIGMCNTDIYVNWEEAPECDLMIINSDNPFAEEMMAQQPKAKKVMLKLSHNARFKSIEEGNLRLPHWDHIITSTDIMKQAAEKCHEDWRHIEWAPEDVTRLGWYHYSHPGFDCPYPNRYHGSLDTRIVIGTLVHPHPLKGTKEAISIMEALKRKYGEKVVCLGIGECTMKPKPEWMQYIYKASRLELAKMFRQMDIWLGCSHTEGLGRMPLELMSSGAVVVNSDTGCEFLEHEKNCLLFPIGNPQEGGLAVQRVMVEPDLRTTLAVNGYETAKKYSNATPYVSSVATIINKIMEKK